MDQAIKAWRFRQRQIQRQRQRQTKTKYRKDYMCGIFSKSRVCKDIKYDILSALSDHHTKTKTKTNTKTNTNTKTKKKYRKDYTCGIFLKSRGCKNIKYFTYMVNYWVT